jgi:NTE family protein
LTENDYTISSIAGSSMGALVGGIYATGKLDTYAKWVVALERIQVMRLLDLAFHRAGLFKLERVISILRELIGDCAIEDLPISFTAVATDLESGEEVWLRHGKLFDAIRASIASVAKIALDHRLNANILFKWRRSRDSGEGKAEVPPQTRT